MALSLRGVPKVGYPLDSHEDRLLKSVLLKQTCYVFIMVESGYNGNGPRTLSLEILAMGM